MSVYAICLICTDATPAVALAHPPFKTSFYSANVIILFPYSRIVVVTHHC